MGRPPREISLVRMHLSLFQIKDGLDRIWRYSERGNHKEKFSLLPKERTITHGSPSTILLGALMRKQLCEVVM